MVRRLDRWRPVKPDGQGELLSDAAASMDVSIIVSYTGW